MWAVLPLKRFQQVKKRLKAALDPAQREQFFSAMVQDVLYALAQSQQLEGTLVVSADTRTQTLARQFGAHWLREQHATDLNSAIAEGCQHLHSQGIDAALIVPGDIPLLTGAIIDSFIQAAAPAPSVTICPCREHDGTNAMILAHPEIITPAYGVASFTRHQHLAEAAQAQLTVVEDEQIGLDIDTPADLQRLMHSGQERRSIECLQLMGIAVNPP